MTTNYDRINPEQAAMEYRMKEIEKENRKLKAGRIVGYVLAGASVVVKHVR